MRIVSLLPSATEIVFALGLGDELVGVTSACDWPAEVMDVPILATAATDIEPPDLATRLATTLHFGATGLVLDDEALRDSEPDLVLTQQRCQVCGVRFTDVRASAGPFGEEVAVVSLEPVSVEGIFNAVSTVGAMAGAEDEAIEVLADLRERLGDVERRIVERQQDGHRPVRVAALEWVDPTVATGHWLPEVIRRSGAWDVLGQEGGLGPATTWAEIRDLDPDVLLAVPSGLALPDAVAAWEAAPRPPFWAELTAVREGRVYAMDAGWIGRPGPRIVDGIHTLAALFDPEGFGSRAALGVVERVG